MTRTLASSIHVSLAVLGIVALTGCGELGPLSDGGIHDSRPVGALSAVRGSGATAALILFIDDRDGNDSPEIYRDIVLNDSQYTMAPIEFRDRHDGYVVYNLGVDNRGMPGDYPVAVATTRGIVWKDGRQVELGEVWESHDGNIRVDLSGQPNTVLTIEKPLTDYFEADQIRVNNLTLARTGDSYSITGSNDLDRGMYSGVSNARITGSVAHGHFEVRNGADSGHPVASHSGSFAMGME